MEQRQFTICQDTQNLEKYLCLNKECYTSKKKQLHCHECLVKLHKTDKNSIKHYEQFVTFDSIVNDLIRRNNKKIESFNQMMIEAHQFKKDKFKELCTFSNCFSNLQINYNINQSINQKHFQARVQSFKIKYLKRLNSLLKKSLNNQMNKCHRYDQDCNFKKRNFNFILNSIINLISKILYLSNDTKFEDSLKLSLEAIKKNIETYIASIELQDSQTIKKKTIQQLQKKIADLEGVKTMPKYDYIPKKTIIFIIIPLMYFIYTVLQIDNQLLKLQIKIDQQSQSILDLQKLLIQELQLLRQEQDNQNKQLIIINNLNNIYNKYNETLYGNNNIKEILINNDSKLTLRIIQLSKKTDEEFNNTNNILKELTQNISKTISIREINYILEPIQFNEQSEILTKQYIIDHLIVGQQRQNNIYFLLQLNFTNAELIYKSKRDGLSMDAFWQSMKKQGSTLLIAKFHNLEIIGAITIPSYQPLFQGDYQVDVTKKSFIFSQTQNQIYKLRDFRFALYSKYMVGPQFGQGPDLSLQGNTFDQCSSNIGYTYEYGKIKGESIINESSKIIEMEVFLLS